MFYWCPRVEVDHVTGAASRVVARNRDGEETAYDADAVIFSVGVTGGQCPQSMLVPSGKLEICQHCHVEIQRRCALRKPRHREMACCQSCASLSACCAGTMGPGIHCPH